MKTEEQEKSIFSAVVNLHLFARYKEIQKYAYVYFSFLRQNYFISSGKSPH